MGIIFAISYILPDITSSDFINMAIRGSVTLVLSYLYIVWKKPSEDIEKLRVKTLALVRRKKVTRS